MADPHDNRLTLADRLLVLIGIIEGEMHGKNYDAIKTCALVLGCSPDECEAAERELIAKGCITGRT